MSNEPNQKRSASQRLDDLESAMLSTFQTVDQLATESQTVREAIKLLGGKLNALVIAVGTDRGPVNDELLSVIMVEENVKDLTAKVDSMRAAGILTEGAEVTESSFVVGREVDSQGVVANPRLQFALAAVSKKQTQDAILGSKAGDLLTLEEGKLQFEVLEVYSIRKPQAAQEPQAEA